MAHLAPSNARTRVLPVDASKIGRFLFTDPSQKYLEDWSLKLANDSADATNLNEAASRLRNTDIPVAFPTETVYGLGADATRSAAVQGIYQAKQRPSDNPLIVHISSLPQLRKLLSRDHDDPVSSAEDAQDPIPPIYYPLISRFWPGPLTILLPLPTPSPFAPEVTNSLPTVGVRMPSSPLALALIHLAGVPLAAPSANASTKPSPTTAAHVLHDLDGRIELILDGGPCTVGVESTVVDGLTQPPEVLRPGGISIEMLRQCPGWKDVRVGYQDGAKTLMPKAPGMKYKHYSPRARVLLVSGPLDVDMVRRSRTGSGSVGILRTKTWRDRILQDAGHESHTNGIHSDLEVSETAPAVANGSAALSPPPPPPPSARHFTILLDTHSEEKTEVWTIGIGPAMVDVARGLFSALRDLDQKGVDVIFVEAVDDTEPGDAAAAVMNRLRKAAEQEIKT